MLPIIPIMKHIGARINDIINEAPSKNPNTKLTFSKVIANA